MSTAAKPSVDQRSAATATTKIFPAIRIDHQLELGQNTKHKTQPQSAPSKQDRPLLRVPDYRARLPVAGCSTIALSTVRTSTDAVSHLLATPHTAHNLIPAGPVARGSALGTHLKPAYPVRPTAGGYRHRSEQRSPVPFLQRLLHSHIDIATARGYCHLPQESLVSRVENKLEQHTQH